MNVFRPLQANVFGWGVAVALALVSPALAGAVRIQPVTLDLPAPTSTGTLTLRNEGRQPMTVQTRIFSWTQDGGDTDVLQPTKDVVVSPPSVTLRPGSDYVLRVVRTTKMAVTGQETYRVLVDELPDPARMQSGRVSLLIRQSIPVFFTAPEATRAQVSWSVSLSHGKLVLKAENTGMQRLKLTDLAVRTADGTVISQQGGLAGYVLGGSSRTWQLKPRLNVGVGSAVILTASGDGRVINVRTQIQNR